MKYIIENLGPIEHAEIELGDLTIIIGASNTGKSLAASAIWYAQRAIMEEGNLVSFKDDNEEVLRKISEYQLEQLDFNIPKKIRGNLEGLFSGSNPFQGAEISLENVDLSAKKLKESMYKVLGEAVRDYSKKKKFLNQQKFMLSYANAFQLNWNSAFINKLSQNRLKEITQEFLEDLLQRIVKNIVFLDKYYFITTDISGCYLWQNDIGRSQSMPQHHKHQLETLRYNTTLPSQIAESHTETGNWYQEHQKELEPKFQDLLDGKLRHDERGPYLVLEKKKKKLRFPLFSSSVRNLTTFYFLIKHFVKAGDFLVFDEPESHLSPNKQHLLMEIICYCARKGIKILLATHSPLIVNYPQETRIYVLEDGQFKEQNSQYGQDANMVFLGPMNANILNKDVKEKFENVLDKLQNREMNDAKDLIKGLEADLPAGNLELNKAKILLRKLELFDEIHNERTRARKAEEMEEKA